MIKPRGFRFAMERIEESAYTDTIDGDVFTSDVAMIAHCITRSCDGTPVLTDAQRHDPVWNTPAGFIVSMTGDGFEPVAA